MHKEHRVLLGHCIISPKFCSNIIFISVSHFESFFYYAYLVGITLFISIMIYVISLLSRITYCNDFSYTKGPNQIEKITSDHLNHFNHCESNTRIVERNEDHTNTVKGAVESNC